MTEEAGRIPPADVATINLVLDALPKEKKVPYGIIINKITKKNIERLKNPKNMGDLLASIYKGRDNLTNHIQVPPEPHLYEEKKELCDEADIVHSVTPEFELFLRQVPFVEIKAEEVSKVADEDKRLRALKLQYQYEQQKISAKRAQQKIEQQQAAKEAAEQKRKHEIDLEQANSSNCCLM